jgi:hypothetical protein
VRLFGEGGCSEEEEVGRGRWHGGQWGGEQAEAMGWREDRESVQRVPNVMFQGL